MAVLSVWCGVSTSASWLAHNRKRETRRAWRRRVQSRTGQHEGGSAGRSELICKFGQTDGCMQQSICLRRQVATQVRGTVKRASSGSSAHVDSAAAACADGRKSCQHSGENLGSMVHTPTSFLSLHMPFWSIVAMLNSRAGAEADSDRHAQAADTMATLRAASLSVATSQHEEVEKSCGSG